MEGEWVTYAEPRFCVVVGARGEEVRQAEEELLPIFAGETLLVSGERGHWLKGLRIADAAAVGAAADADADADAAAADAPRMRVQVFPRNHVQMLTGKVELEQQEGEGEGQKKRPPPPERPPVPPPPAQLLQLHEHWAKADRPRSAPSSALREVEVDMRSVYSSPRTAPVPAARGVDETLEEQAPAAGEEDAGGAERSGQHDQSNPLNMAVESPTTPSRRASLPSPRSPSSDMLRTLPPAELDAQPSATRSDDTVPPTPPQDFVASPRLATPVAANSTGKQLVLGEGSVVFDEYGFPIDLERMDKMESEQMFVGIQKQRKVWEHLFKTNGSEEQLFKRTAAWARWNVRGSWHLQPQSSQVYHQQHLQVMAEVSSKSRSKSSAAPSSPSASTSSSAIPRFLSRSNSNPPSVDRGRANGGQQQQASSPKSPASATASNTSGGTHSGPLLRAMKRRYNGGDRSDAGVTKAIRGGVPPELREKVWWACVGGDKKMKSAHAASQYPVMVQRYNQQPTASAEDIEKDLYRTFPTNANFGSEEGVASLRRILQAYSLRNPEVGYCQSMNFITAILLLHLDEEKTYWALAAIIEDILPPDYFTPSMIGNRADLMTFKSCLQWKLPRLYQHMHEASSVIEPLLCGWFLCLFVNTLTLESTLRVWDCFLHEGHKVLHRISLALFKLNENDILASDDFVDIITILRNPMGVKDEEDCAAQMYASGRFSVGRLIRTAYDKRWLRDFPMRKIEAARRQHLETLLEEAKVRESSFMAGCQPGGANTDPAETTANGSSTAAASDGTGPTARSVSSASSSISVTSTASAPTPLSNSAMSVAARASRGVVGFFRSKSARHPRSTSSNTVTAVTDGRAPASAGRHARHMSQQHHQRVRHSEADHGAGEEDRTSFQNPLFRHSETIALRSSDTTTTPAAAATGTSAAAAAASGAAACTNATSDQAAQEAATTAHGTKSTTRRRSNSHQGIATSLTAVNVGDPTTSPDAAAPSTGAGAVVARATGGGESGHGSGSTARPMHASASLQQVDPTLAALPMSPLPTHVVDLDAISGFAVDGEEDDDDDEEEDDSFEDSSPSYISHSPNRGSFDSPADMPGVLGQDAPSGATSMARRQLMEKDSASRDEDEPSTPHSLSRGSSNYYSRRSSLMRLFSNRQSVSDAVISAVHRSRPSEDGHSRKDSVRTMDNPALVAAMQVRDQQRQQEKQQHLLQAVRHQTSNPVYHGES